MAGAGNYFITAYTEVDGIVTDVTLYDSSDDNVATTTVGTVAALDGNITLGGVAHTYTDDCIVWVLDKTKSVVTEKFVPKTVSQIGTDTNDTVCYIADDDSGKVSKIFVIKAAAGADTSVFVLNSENGGSPITSVVRATTADDGTITLAHGTAVTGPALVGAHVINAMGSTFTWTMAGATLADGDTLVVTAADGTTTYTYVIDVA